MSKMKKRYIVYFLVAFFCRGLIVDMCMAKDVVRDVPCIEKVYNNTISELYPETKVNTVPLYRFKQDVTGRFLERLCDSLGDFEHYEFMTIDEVEKLNFPHDGDAEEYVYISSESVSDLYVLSAQAAIILPSYETVILQHLNDKIINLLHLEEYGRIALRYGEAINVEFIYATTGPASSLLHIMSDGKVDPINIYDLRKSSRNSRYGWINQYYIDNSLSPKASYDYMPVDMPALGLLSDSIPKELLFNQEIFMKGKKKMVDIVNIKFEDIIRLKYNDYKKTYSLILPPYSPDSLKSRLQNVKDYYIKGDSSLEPLMNLYPENW